MTRAGRSDRCSSCDAANARHLLTDILVIAIRRVWATGQIDWLKRRNNWSGLNSVIVVESNHGDQNLAALRRIALGLLRRDKSIKPGAKNKWLRAGRKREYLLHVLLSKAQAK